MPLRAPEFATDAAAFTSTEVHILTPSRAVPLIAPEFAIDAAAVEAAITSKTRMIVHNTPHNPTGHVTTPREMEALAAVCVTHTLTNADGC